MQKDSKIYFIGGVIVAIAILGAVVYAAKKSPAARELDTFATCLKDQGAVFYGAFWCPHCLATKRLFGKSVDKLEYVECSTPDGNGQLQVCADKKIESYPTWIFKDGSRLTGEISLETLAAKTSCPLVRDGDNLASSTPVTSATSSSAASPALSASTTLTI